MIPPNKNKAIVYIILSPLIIIGLSLKNLALYMNFFFKTSFYFQPFLYVYRVKRPNVRHVSDQELNEYISLL